jgi:hypothetical protein
MAWHGMVGQMLKTFNKEKSPQADRKNKVNYT